MLYIDAANFATISLIGFKFFLVIESFLLLLFFIGQVIELTPYIVVSKVKNNFIEIQNIGKGKQFISSWTVKYVVDGKELSFKLPFVKVFRPNTVFRIWAQSANAATTAKNDIQSKIHCWLPGEIY